MSPLMMLLIVWGAITVALVVLLIYRSTLTMHEDDQLFLDDSSLHMQEEQLALQRRMGKIQPFVRVLGVASGLLIVVIAGVWIWQGINQSF
jgi:Tfp pilus assembly protein PilN